MSPVATSRAPARALPREDRQLRERRANLRIVGPRERRARTGPIVAIALVVVFASVLASAVFHSVLVSGQGRLDDLQRRVEAARQGVAQERLALAEAQSPDKLAADAQRLGMVVPSKQIWLAPPAPGGTTPPPVVVDRGADATNTDATNQDGAGEATAVTTGASDGTDATGVGATDGDAGSSPQDSTAGAAGGADGDTP